MTDSEYLKKSLTTFARLYFGQEYVIVEAEYEVREESQMKSIAEILRNGAQRAGISDARIDWPNLPKHRQERWEIIVDGLRAEGYTVVQISDLATLRALAMRDENAAWREGMGPFFERIDSALGIEGSDDTPAEAKAEEPKCSNCGGLGIVRPLYSEDYISCPECGGSNLYR